MICKHTYIDMRAAYISPFKAAICVCASTHLFLDYIYSVISITFYMENLATAADS